MLMQSGNAFKLAVCLEGVISTDIPGDAQDLKAAKNISNYNKQPI